MPRVKRGVTSKARHSKVRKLVKGHRGGRSKLVRQAKESLLHSGQYAFAGRRQRRRDMRRLWITQINIALRAENLTYSKFIDLLKKGQVNLDRKILAEMAVHQPESFKEIITKFK